MSWVTAGEAAAIVKARRFAFDVDGRQVLVVAHEGGFYAFDNICVHRQRELTKGVVLNGKLVCPGHQWAFALDSGWEAVKECYQPTFPVRVSDDGIVEVDIAPAADNAPAPSAADGS
ncbi:MAG TPA: Rieske 2Fe-2S domain-containing protein [Ilumatobacter sp.]|nr:Rieske 2Fe-2S domain-containing protein [Ilumatobacter sp.]